jgi:hypothetical protein
MTISVPLPVTAVANTDFIIPLPQNAQNVTFRTVTTTAYGAATDATLQIGKTAAGAEYVAAVTIKAVGVVNHTLVTTNLADLNAFPAATTLTARIVQSGAASATGTAVLYVTYSLLM